MCSVLGCSSSHRAPRFKLPEDPEIRLEWVQFLAAANKQCFKEKSWTDINVCSEHFRYDCLVYVAPTGSVQLTPGAIPTVFRQPVTNRQPPNACKAVPKQDSPEPPPSCLPELITVIDEDESISGTETSSERAIADSDGELDPSQNLVLKKEPENDEDEDDDDDDNESEDEGEQYGYSTPYTTHCKLCTECGRFFRNRWPHMCEHKRRPFSCNICGKRCANEVALINHDRVHNEDYVHRCKYCHRTFKVKVDKLNHEPTHITEGKPYKCAECSERFATNKERRVHLKKHRDPEDLKCHICGLEFLWALSVQRHMAVHTGLRPYKCSVCQRGFNQASHLKSHMRLHTGERPYKCQHCDKCFNHNVSLKNHVQRYHTPGSALPENKKDKKKGRAADNSQGDSKKMRENAAREQNSEEEKSVKQYKQKRRSTGRPKGRPKSFASDDLVVAIQLEHPCSKSKGRKRKAQRSRRKKRSVEESEEEAAYSDFDLTEEGLINAKDARDTNDNDDDDNDSDFDPGRRK